MDSIHRSSVEPLFEALEEGRHIIAPVVRDQKHGYRIDLSAVPDFFPRKKSEPVLPPPSPPKTKEPKAKEPRGKARVTRAQFNIDTETLQAVERLAKAEGYPTYTDWLRALLERVLEAAQREDVQ